MHVIVMCMESDYDRWQEDNLYLFTGSGWCYPDNNKPEKNHFYTREEAIEFEKTNKYVRKDVNWTDEEEVNEILRENEFYDYKYFWNEYCEDYEGYEETLTTPNGDKVVAFGCYGYEC